jgi:hypothetical protein
MAKSGTPIRPTQLTGGQYGFPQVYLAAFLLSIHPGHIFGREKAQVSKS